MPSQAVPWQWLLRVEILHRNSPRFCLHSLPCRTASELSQSQSYITTDGQSASLSGSYDQIFITVRQLRVCWYGAPSLTRGRVCRLQSLLSSPVQSFSDPSPAGLMTTFYCLRFETAPTWRTRSLYLYPPGTGWPGYTPQALGPASELALSLTHNISSRTT
jgi:hypothetical protein